MPDNDPFSSSIRTLDDAPELRDVDSIDDTLEEPFDEFPDFGDDASPEVDAAAALAVPHVHRRQAGRRLFRDYRADTEALRHLDPLPAERESIHIVIGQRYSMFDVLPALITRTGQDVAHLYVATLSYSVKTARDLIGLLDDGRVKQVGLIVSAYFRAQNAGIYNALVTPLIERGHRVISMRNHAKVMLVETAAGEQYVVEGSANLRSNKNLEQLCVTRCGGLFEFHRGWMDQLLSRREDQR